MTVQEALLQSGFTQAQIDAMDAKALTAFGGILTTAEQKEAAAQAAATKAEADRQAAAQSAQAAKEAQEKAELEKRSNIEFYETKVMPGLIGYEDEKKILEAAKINAEAAVAFYKSQIEGAKAAGFVPADAPAFVAQPPTPNPGRGADGRFVPGGNTPGSPTFVSEQDFFKRVDTGLGTIADIQWKYQSLYGGKPLPVSPSQLVQQADALKLSPMEYAARTFRFAEMEEGQRQAAAKAHDDEIRAAATAEAARAKETEIAALAAKFETEKKQLSERRGNNPDISAAGPSRIAEVRKAVQVGEAKDPLKMTDAERRAATRQMVHKDVEAQQGAVA